MAYKQKPSVDTDANYKKWVDRNELKDTKYTKDSFKGMAKVRDALEQSRSALMSSCFWDAYQVSTQGGTNSGGSWYERWNLQEKMALMWYMKPNADDFISNIKSPMARGRINTFVNWMKKINLEFGAAPNNKDDRNAAFMADKTTNYWFNNSSARQVLGDAWEELGTHGNAYLKLSYMKDYRTFTFPKYKDLSEDETKDVEENGKKIVYGEPEKHLIIDDIVLENVPIRELYPDPTGRNFHGDSYKCGWVVRKRYVTLEWLKAVYGDHPNVDAKLLEKVKGAASYKDTTEYFFEPPKNMMSENIVELLEYENQDEDMFIVVANDMPIIGANCDVPLPQNHKEISYHKLDFIRIPGQFFSMGICDLLDNIQASYEVALNMVADYVYRTYNYKLLVESDNYGEIKQAMQRTGDMFVPIDISDGRSLQQKIMPLQVSPIGFDIFQFLQLLETNATLATNIDPAQMALLAGSKTATSDILNKELLMTMIGGVIDNNTNGDLRAIGRQLWKLQQQHYTKPRVKKIVGDKEEDVQEYRTLRFEGIEIEVDQDSQLLYEKEIDADYSFFELKEEYLSTKDEVDIFIKPESKEVQSQALEEQRMGEEFAQLVPFAIDPNNPDQAQMHQMPMIDATKLFREYFDVKRLPSDLLINKSKDNSKAIQNAEKHVMQILQGKTPRAIPGQASKHIEYEYAVLDGLTAKYEELMKDLEKDLSRKMAEIQKQMAGMPPFDPFTGQPIEVPQPEPDQRIVDDLQKVDDKITKLQQHLMVEAMPASMRNSRILMMMEQQNQPPMPVQPQAGQNAMMDAQAQGGMMQAPMPEGGEAPITPEMLSGQNPAQQVPMGAAPMAPVPGMGPIG